MQIVNMLEAKSTLSKLVDAVERGLKLRLSLPAMAGQQPGWYLFQHSR